MVHTLCAEKQVIIPKVPKLPIQQWHAVSPLPSVLAYVCDLSWGGGGGVGIPLPPHANYWGPNYLNVLKGMDVAFYVG